MKNCYNVLLICHSTCNEIYFHAVLILNAFRMSSVTLCEPFRCVSVAKSILRGTENTLSQTRGVSYDFLESERRPSAIKLRYPGSTSPGTTFKRFQWSRHESIVHFVRCVEFQGSLLETKTTLPIDTDSKLKQQRRMNAVKGQRIVSVAASFFFPWKSFFFVRYKFDEKMLSVKNIRNNYYISFKFT